MWRKRITIVGAVLASIVATGLFVSFFVRDIPFDNAWLILLIFAPSITSVAAFRFARSPIGFLPIYAAFVVSLAPTVFSVIVFYLPALLLMSVVAVLNLKVLIWRLAPNSADTQS